MDISATLPAIGATGTFDKTVNYRGSALQHTPNSIGLAAYYDRSTGQANQLEHFVDSTVVQYAYDTYNANAATIKTAIDKYNEDKTKYEAGTLADKPDMPTTLGSYATTLPKWRFSEYATKAWSTLKTETTLDFTLVSKGV